MKKRAIYVGETIGGSEYGNTTFLGWGQTGIYLTEQKVFVPDQENKTSCVSWLFKQPWKCLYFPRG
jgi:hypothetical protein